MNTYMPYAAEVVGVDELSMDSVLISSKFKDSTVAKEFDFIPGQFVEFGIAGYGEIPVGIASAPKDKDKIQVSVRKVGNVSEAVHRLEVGDTVGIRGPFGNGFKKEWIGGKDLIIVSGGCGIPPMRSLVLDVVDNLNEYGKVTLLYGSRTQQDLLFRKEFKDWTEKIDLRLTVDTDEGPDPELGLDCGVGVVTTLLDGLEITDKSVSVMCGPPIMYKFVIQKLIEMGMSEEKILVSLERRMKCGVGKCQHCNRGSKYVCLDGPVFTYSEMLDEYGGL
jgi:NAD(P)H-flavin reductase